MAVNRFQDLIAWQKARVLASSVYLTTRAEPFSRDFGLSGQIQRAAVSVMANIAEGFERNRPNEFQRYLEIARGSRGEVLSHLYVALDIGYISPARFAEQAEMCEEVKRLIDGLKAAAARATANSRAADSGLGTRDSTARTRQ